MSENQNHHEQNQPAAAQSRQERLRRLLKLDDEAFDKTQQSVEQLDQLDIPVAKLMEHKKALATYVETNVQPAIDRLLVSDKTQDSITNLLAREKARAMVNEWYPPAEDESDSAATKRNYVVDMLTLPSEVFQKAVEAHHEAGQNAEVIDEAKKLRDEEDEAHARNALYNKAQRTAQPAMSTQKPQVREPQAGHTTEAVAPAEKQEKLKVRARTFEEAQKITKTFRPETIMQMVNDQLKVAESDRNSAAIKYWFDKQPVTPEENTFIDNTEAVKNFHTQLSKMIQNNVHIVTSDFSQIVDNLPARTEEYKQSLARRDKSFRKKADHFFNGGGVEDWRGIATDAFFKGFGVETALGEVALANRDDKNKSGIRSNIDFQEGGSGGFVHWETDVRAKRKADEVFKGQEQVEEASRFGKRIYLNPKSEVACAVFEEIMQSLNGAGLEAHGKILDRSSEALALKMLDKDSRVTRSDELLIYATDADANKVLSMVLEKVEEYKDSFAGRSTPRATQRIYDGVAVGDEPTTKDSSLTSSRANLANQVVGRVRSDLNLTPGQVVPQTMQNRVVALFNQHLTEIAKNMGINPNNISFNAQA